jgi:hypothetical protein
MMMEEGYTTCVSGSAIIRSLQGHDPKDAVRIGEANDFVKLQEINVIGLQPAQRILELLLGRFSISAIDLGHEKYFLPIAIPQRFAHADLAHAVVIIPAVIHEVDPLVDHGPDEADTLLLVGLLAEVIAPQPYERYLLAGVSQRAVRYPLFRVGSP